jgi:histidinol-phosphate aminotransferase
VKLSLPQLDVGNRFQVGPGVSFFATIAEINQADLLELESGKKLSSIQELVQLRIALAGVFEEMPMVEVVYPSDTNFLLIKIPNATKLYQFLLTKGIVVRDRSNLPNCADTLRITVGTEQENTALVDAMIEWMEQQLT